jgi:hypothetical protein
MLHDVPSAEEFWIPLVDEPIGAIVARVHDEREEIATLVDSPRKLLAFRTFAYIRVGILLGRLLVDSDIPPDDGGGWVEQLATEHHEAVVREVLAVAEEVAADPAYAEDQLGPSDEERRRFSEFARNRLA